MFERFIFLPLNGVILHLSYVEKDSVHRYEVGSQFSLHYYE